MTSMKRHALSKYNSQIFAVHLMARRFGHDLEGAVAWLLDGPWQSPAPSDACPEVTVAEELQQLSCLVEGGTLPPVAWYNAVADCSGDLNQAVSLLVERGELLLPGLDHPAAAGLDPAASYDSYGGGYASSSFAHSNDNHVAASFGRQPPSRGYRHQEGQGGTPPRSNHLQPPHQQSPPSFAAWAQQDRLMGPQGSDDDGSSCAMDRHSVNANGGLQPSSLHLQSNGSPFAGGNAAPWMTEPSYLAYNGSAAMNGNVSFGDWNNGGNKMLFGNTAAMQQAVSNRSSLDSASTSMAAGPFGSTFTAFSNSNPSSQQGLASGSSSAFAPPGFSEPFSGGHAAAFGAKEPQQQARPFASGGQGLEPTPGERPSMSLSRMGSYAAGGPSPLGGGGLGAELGAGGSLHAQTGIVSGLGLFSNAANSNGGPPMSGLEAAFGRSTLFAGYPPGANSAMPLPTVRESRLFSGAWGMRPNEPAQRQRDNSMGEDPEVDAAAMIGSLTAH